MGIPRLCEARSVPRLYPIERLVKFPGPTRQNPRLPHRDTISGSRSNLNRSCIVMRGLEPRIHLLAKEDGLPGQGRQ
jgi:hypothetical protein